MIERVEYVHSKHFIHRDIKPDNFVIGLNENIDKIYLIDFGLAKRYKTTSGKHIPFKEDK
jgi:serine/threonine protein kinase